VPSLGRSDEEHHFLESNAISPLSHQTYYLVMSMTYPNHDGQGAPFAVIIKLNMFRSQPTGKNVIKEERRATPQPCPSIANPEYPRWNLVAFAPWIHLILGAAFRRC
jgi:hypothetical protein